MNKHYPITLFIFIVASLLWLSGCQSSRDGSSLSQGAAKIQPKQTLAQWPPKLQKIIFVDDFELKAERLEHASDSRKNAPEQYPGQSTMNPVNHSNPEIQARTIVDSLSNSLVNALNKRGFIAQRLPLSGVVMPHEGWLLQGVFTETDSGNRIKRAVIGPGHAVSTMEAQAAISDLASNKPKMPFIVFGTVKQPKKSPDASDPNPYVVAARFSLEKNAVTRDIQKTAEIIVDEIVKHANQFKERNNAIRAVQ